MKKILVIALVVAISLMGATAAMARIAGSKHDLSSSSTNTGLHATGNSLSACQFCHTPHLGNNDVVTGAPLWNRTMGTGGFSTPGGGTYQVYGATASGATGTTLAGRVVDAPGPNSKTCLSCHDGTLAMSTVLVGDNSGITGWANNAGEVDGTNKLTSTSTAMLGVDLRQEHPVGVVYNNSAPNQAGLNASVNATDYTINGKKWKIYGGGLNAGTVECGSCHDPHGDDSIINSLTSPFLKDTKTTICIDCHSLK
jgi:predicted CXXCH cytochrome family protein